MLLSFELSQLNHKWPALLRLLALPEPSGIDRQQPYLWVLLRPSSSKAWQRGSRRASCCEKNIRRASKYIHIYASGCSLSQKQWQTKIWLVSSVAGHLSSIFMYIRCPYKSDWQISTPQQHRTPRLWKWHFHRDALQVLAPRRMKPCVSMCFLVFWNLQTLENKNDEFGIQSVDEHQISDKYPLRITLECVGWINEHPNVSFNKPPRLTAVGCLVGARILDRTICVYTLYKNL